MLSLQLFRRHICRGLTWPSWSSFRDE